MKIRAPTKGTYFSDTNYSPLEMYREMLTRLNDFARIIGCDTFTPGYTIFNKTMISLWLLVVMTTAEIIYAAYENLDDLVKCIFALAFIPVVMQVVARMYSFIIRKDKLIDVFHKVDKFYQSYNEIDWCRKISEQNIMYSCHIMLFLTLMLIGGGFFIIIYPAVVYFFLDELVLHFGFRLFFVDWQTPIGYTFNCIFNVGGVILICMGTILVCIDITVCVLCSYSQYDILKGYLEQLNDLLINKLKYGKVDEMEIKKKIALITDLHNYVVKFLDDFNSLFVPFYFVEIGSSIIQTSMMLFSITTMNFFPGYIIALVAMYQIFVPCVFGTLLTIKGDEYYDNLCNICWYYLSVSDQKSLALLLTGAYRDRTLTTGLTVLNLESFVEILKATYSYYTLITSFYI